MVLENISRIIGASRIRRMSLFVISLIVLALLSLLVAQFVGNSVGTYVMTGFPTS